MPFQCAEQFAAVPLPQFDRAVITPAGQGAAHRIKGDARDNRLVPFQRAQQFHAPRQVPAHRFIGPAPACL